MKAKWTDKGLKVEVTNTRHGMLEQGGVSGRIEHYSDDDVNELGYTRQDDLDGCADGEAATRMEMIRHHLTPRVLRKGTLIA